MSPEPGNYCSLAGPAPKYPNLWVVNRKSKSDVETELPWHPQAAVGGGSGIA